MSHTNNDSQSARRAFWIGFPVVLGLFSGWNQIGMVAPSLPLTWSVVYWLLLSAVMWAGLALGTLVVSKFTQRVPYAITLVAGALLGVTLTRPVHAAFQTLFVPLASHHGSIRTLPFAPFRLADWALLFGGNAMLMLFWVGGSLFFAHFLDYAPFSRERGVPILHSSAIAFRTSAPLVAARLDRLRFDDIDVIRAEDHYLRMFAAQGEELVLYRFADAVAELSGDGWTRIHRSFCVRDSAVMRRETRGRTVELVMQNGQHVPVSERYRAVVERMGS